MGKKIGVLLSGCGVMDGAEIHESVLTLLALDRLGAEAVCMAPNIPQMHVVNHLKGEPAGGQSRNVLEESARIARGKIKNIVDVRAFDIDALILPGGFGAAKNLSNYATKGAACEVNPEVARLIREVHSAGKPVGFICISPVIAAKLLGAKQVRVTIGTDKATAADIEEMGAVHEMCPVGECRIDKAMKVVSTPAYMLAKSVAEAAEGIERLVKEVVKMA